MKSESVALRRQLQKFHESDPGRTRILLAQTLMTLLVCWAATVLPLPLIVRLLASLLVAGLLFRLCSFGHDYLHGATFRHSVVAKVVFSILGGVLLAPPRVWAYTHNFHHRHNGSFPMKSVGTFPIAGVQKYLAFTPTQRTIYRFVRSPLAVLLAWPLVFVLGLNLRYFLHKPRRYLSSGLTLLLHGIVYFLIWTKFGALTWLFSIGLPYTLMGIAGAYFFYAQHNFPGARFLNQENWTHAEAALASSSYMALPKWMHWFSGNIGYHHIHHLDAHVPFYNLPEAFAQIPELNRRPDTQLTLRDIFTNFSLVAWDENKDQLVALRR